MALEDIIKPPEHPVYNGYTTDWDVIERILGTKLPADYKQLVNIYGTGCFLEFLYPLTPFAPFETSLNLISGDTRHILQNYRSGQKDFPQYTPPFTAYPDEAGLFPWATTVNGDTLFWLRQGSPNQWQIVVCDSKFSKRFDKFKMSTKEFLFRLFSGKLMPKAFPEDLPTMPLVFTPYSPKAKEF